MDKFRRFAPLPVVGSILIVTLGCGISTPFAETPTTATATSIPDLAPGMEIGLVGTTGFGLISRGEVDPDVPGGGTWVTIDEVEPGQEITISWRRTVEREVEPDEPTPVTGVGTPSPTPVTESVSEEGVIVSTGLDGAHGVLLPLYWQPDTAQTDTSLIWLSQEAFAELRESRSTRWSPDVLTRFSQFSLETIREIEDKVDEEEFSLNAEADFVSYEISVNGERVELQAIKAYDDFGNEYVILADERNPLIVSFTFNAVSTGVIGIDVGVWTLIKATFSGYRVLEINAP